MAPDPPDPPLLRAITTLLLATAEQPLPLRRDGRLPIAGLRQILPRLAPMAPDDATALLHLLLPLVQQMGLLAPHGAGAALAPAGARFLALPPATQLARLQQAWIAAPQPDAWLTPLVPHRRGLDWPVIRRRFCAWAAALPVGQLLDPAGLYERLAATFGPLADAQTHSLRPVDRAPWQPRRAAAIWDAALRGPLTWLGIVAWADPPSANADSAAGDAPAASPPAGRCCFATPWAQIAADVDPPAVMSSVRPTPEQTPAPTPWRYGVSGALMIPHAALDATMLRLLPFATWQAADAASSVYQITPQRLAQAHAHGAHPSQLWALLEQQAGPLPPAWRADLAPVGPAPIRIIHAAVAVADAPALLDRATQARSAGRHVAAHLAPGVALVAPEHVAPFTRALARQDLAVTVTAAPGAAPAGLSAAECATLLAACIFYRRHAPPDSPSVPTGPLEARLRAALPPALRPAMATDHPPLADPTGADLELPPDVRAPLRPAALAAPSASPDHGLPPCGAAAPWVLALRRRAGAVGGVCLSWLLLTWVALWTVALAGPRRWAHRHVRPAPQPSRSTAGDGARLLAARDHPGTAAAPNGPAASVAARPAATGDPPPPEPPGPARTMVQRLRQGIAHRDVITMTYTTAMGATTTRTIRPLRLERHGATWYLHAYCTLRQAERVFRVDRMGPITVVGRRARRGGGGRRARVTPLPSADPALPWAEPAQPSPTARPAAAGAARASARCPRRPPPGSPLVRVWLDEG